MISPDRGISREMRWLSEAYVVPPRRRAYTQVAGVVDHDGGVVSHGVTWSAMSMPMTSPPERPEAAETLAGNWLYAGNLRLDFGHAITEGLSRLWALRDIRPDRLDGLLYTLHNPRASASSMATVIRMIRHFGIDLPVMHVDQPLQVERLCVPGQGYGLGPMGGGTPEFRALVRDGFATDIAPKGASKLYLSRSRLPLLQGGASNEPELETLLSGEGFDVYHPQDHDLDHQIATIKGAREIVGLEGSAFHLVALVPCPGQRVTILQRDLRTDFFARTMAAQVEALYPAKTAGFIDGALAQHRPKKHRRGWRTGVTTLDLSKIIDALHEAGTLAKRTTTPDAKASLAATETLLKEQGLDYEVLRPDTVT